MTGALLRITWAAFIGSAGRMPNADLIPSLKMSWNLSKITSIEMNSSVRTDQTVMRAFGLAVGSAPRRVDWASYLPLAFRSAEVSVVPTC